MSRYSSVWAFFSKIDRDSKQVAKCNLCYVELSGHRAGNARKHLRTIHNLTVAANIANGADDGLTQKVPLNLRNEIEELKQKKASLLTDVAEVLGERHLLTPASPAPHRRVARSNHLDKELHKGHNRDATRRWRERRAYKGRLEAEIEQIETLKRTAVAQQRGAERTQTNGAQSMPVNAFMRPVFIFTQPPSTSYTTQGMWLTQAEEFLGTLVEVKLLNTFVHGDWCRQCYVDVITQLYRAANKRSTMAALFGSFLNRLPDAYYEWLGMSSDAVVGAADAQLRPYLEAICFCDLKAVEAGKLAGFILEYGSKRLGGVYLRFDDASRTINVFGPLLPRELLCSPISIRFIAALLKQQGYHRWFDRIEFLVPRNLIGLFEPLLATLGTAPENDLPTKLGLQPAACVGYSLSIAYVVNMFT